MSHFVVIAIRCDPTPINFVDQCNQLLFFVFILLVIFILDSIVCVCILVVIGVLCVVEIDYMHNSGCPSVD